MTFQVPLSRTSHSFSLVEANGGSTIVTPTTAASVANGYFNSNGQWTPFPTAYSVVQVERQSNANFWLKDVTTNEYGPVNQTGLVNVQWRETDGQTAMRYFSIPEDRAGHMFIVQYPGGDTLNVTVGSVQGAYGDHGGFISYGFCEASASRLPSGDTGWRLVDVTTLEQGPVEAEQLIGQTWEPFSGTLPVYQATFVVDYTTQQGGGIDYTVHTFGGSAQSITSVLDNGREICTAAIPQGTYFWLVRNYDSRQSGFYLMGGQNVEIDENAVFAVLGPNWSYMYFVFSGYSVGTGYVVYPDGEHTEITQDPANYVDAWDANGSYVPYPVVTGYVYVDLNRVWTIQYNGYDLGQGQYFNHPSTSGLTYAAPTGWLSLGFPGSRANHALQFSDSITGPWNFTFQGVNSVGGNYGPNGEWSSWNVSFMTTPYETNATLGSVFDSDAGEVFNFDFSTNSAATQNWFVQQPLNLRISTTRFNHDLRVRVGNGQEFPVNAHAVQGIWSAGNNGVPVFQGFGYFNASTTIFPDLQWWLLDYSRIDGNGIPAVLQAGSTATDFSNDLDTTDSDGDGWQDWYERLVGTNPLNADTDGDGLWDSIDPNPRAQAANPSSSTLRVFTPLE